MADTFQPKALEIDQEEAKLLFKTGSVLLFLDVPEGTEVGIDYHIWKVGPNFKGIKFIPPGLHFVYYSAVSKEGKSAPRTGFFQFFAPTQVVVKQWDAETEDAVDVGDKDQEARLALAIREFDPFLGTYPLDTAGKWRALTNYVSQDVLNRHNPRSGKIYSVTPVVQGEGEEAEPGTSSSGSSGNAVIAKAEDALRFTKIPAKSYPPHATPQVMSKYSMDKSWLVQHLLKTKYANDYKNMLGELQFAFVCFLVGHVYDAFEQWKALTALLCSCDELLVEMPRLFIAFMDVLQWHLNETPADFFIDIVARNNFLASTLHHLFTGVDQADVSPQLKAKVAQLKAFATKRFDWTFDEEDDEDMPQVVEM